jgi:hypothetical protein
MRAENSSPILPRGCGDRQEGIPRGQLANDPAQTWNPAFGVLLARTDFLWPILEDQAGTGSEEPVVSLPNSMVKLDNASNVLNRRTLPDRT